MAGDPSELLRAPVTPRLKSRVKVGGSPAPLPKREPAPSNVEIADDGTHRLLQAAGLSAEEWRITKLWGSASNPSFSVERRDGISVSLSADELDEVLSFPSPLSVAQRGPQDPSRTCPEGAPKRSYLVALGDMQFGKLENHDGTGSGIVETIERTMRTLDEAYRLYWWYAQRYDITEVVVSFLGDHVEGFVSQGGANAWRTPNTLTEQIRVTRRIMLYAMQLFATLGIPVRMVAIPGNHGEAHRIDGRGVTRYDDSHDTECLISVSDAAKLNPEAFGHVSFYVPETDELSVALDLNGTLTAFTHGHMMKPGKYHEWVKGQAYNRGSIFRDVDAVFLGHWHHGHYEESSDRVIVIVPTLETGSQWWKHATGEASMQGIVVATLGEGGVDGIEFVRT